MSLTKADERWLACLDRALEFNRTNMFSGPESVVAIANEFYVAMNGATRGRPSLPERIPVEKTPGSSL